MSNLMHCTYGPEGPLGFPMTDKQARNLDTLLKAMPKSKEFEYRKTVFAKGQTELNPGERSDVSWISTETPDRYNHVVFAKGMNDSQYALNPIVTLNHAYDMPPIGRSLWRKFVKDGAVRGIKAKTLYPPMPAAWPGADVWLPDKVFALIQAGLLNAKSIGWLPTKAHFADAKEMLKNSWTDGTLVVEEWLLIEYAVGSIPVNPETVVEAVSKMALPTDFAKVLGWKESVMAPTSPADPLVRFTSLDEIERAIKSRVSAIDFTDLTRETIERMRGRV